MSAGKGSSNTAFETNYAFNQQDLQIIGLK